MLDIERIGFWEEIKQIPQTNNQALTSDTTPERVTTTNGNRN